eukprot:CAMPEP_0194029520 /NCGR_PEP_ID=MMETSP0009_2-20130614/3218_1 /TAXON_ID=210454 /ORGANISM="Grammatophora oceanica, Strain CCMP 410" /LENGTH=283 /DNA_ID=CAMNT_0038669209 /DNA_START=879 /DNA_END=1730 /DNA_ORIENTATION=-
MQKGHLLLMRFHRCHLQKPFNHGATHKFLKRLKGRIKGFEAHRTGGSSGEAAVNKDLLDFLSRQCFFPRRPNGVKLLPKKDGRAWACYYIAPYRYSDVSKKQRKKPRTLMPGLREVKYYSYTPPVAGGKFHVKSKKNKKDDIWSDYKHVFVPFQKVKLDAGLILKELQSRTNTYVQPAAVQMELETFHSIEAELSHDKKESGEAYRLAATQCNFTLILRPVGYHRDVFDRRNKGLSCLENRICFSAKQTQDSFDLGRGGGGPEWKTFAMVSYHLGERRVTRKS